MKTTVKLLIFLSLISLVASARKRDPLTEAETDQLREVAMDPYHRLKLLIKFTEARLEAIDAVRADPKVAKERGTRIHDLLEDFTALLDEINDNEDMYEGRKLNKDDNKWYHKGLKEVLEADNRFDQKLKALKSASETDPQLSKFAPDFRFVIQDAEEALKSNTDMTREYVETSNLDEKDKKEKPDKQK